MNELTGFTPGTFQDSLPRDQRSYSLAIERLPAGEPSNRLKRLELHVEDLRVLCPSFEQRSDSTTEKLAAERRLQRMIDPPAKGGFALPDDNQSVLDARRELGRLTAEAARINNLYTERSKNWEAASGALANVTQWLRAGIPGNATLAAVETEPPKLLAKETLPDAIERLRRRGRELKIDLQRIQSAPFDSSFCKQRAREMLETLAQRGAPNVSMLIERDGEIAWPSRRVTSQVFSGENGGLAFTEIPDMLALFAWTFKSALLAALDREIDGQSNDRSALSHEVRERQEAEIASDILACERDECWFAWAAQSQNLPVEHRVDISALALLGLRLVTVSPAAALPTSSPEVAWPISIGS